MKNKFGLGLILGVIALIGMGAAANKLIHNYADRVVLLDPDMFLLDTGTEYRSVTWGKIAGVVTNIAAYQVTLSTNNPIGYVNAATNTLGSDLTTDYQAYSDASTNTLASGLEAYTDNYVSVSTNALALGLSLQTTDATNVLAGQLQSYTDDATNGLRSYVDGTTNSLGTGLRAYSDSTAVVVIPGVNNTVVTNGNSYQVNVVPEGGGSATNVVWPIAGANMTGSTNVLEVTLNADVSLASVAAKASTSELQSATNVATLAANGITTNAYVQAATNDVLSTATTRITAATNTLWGLVNTNGLGTGLRSYTDDATNGLNTALRSYTDAATNDVLSTATTRITSATNSTYSAAVTYATATTNTVLLTATTRITAATNAIAAASLTGTIDLARLSGITSNQIAAATDAAYRASGGDVTTAQLVDATNSALSVATTRITAATNSIYGASTNVTAQATNGLWSAVDSRVVGATNGLWGLVNTNGLGTGLRAYSDTFVVIPGVNTTVATNGHAYQVNASGGSEGSATNVVWPSAGSNMTGSTNTLTVTLNADVSLASVAAKASTNQLQSATNLATLAGMGFTTNAYVQAATNTTLSTATTRITSATNTIWAMVNTNGLGSGLRTYTGVATNSLWNAVNTNATGTALRTYTDNATNQVLATATTRITSATNLLWSAVGTMTNSLGSGLRTYTDAATNAVLATATSRITSATNSLLVNPVVTGSITVTGGSGTNDFYGVNNITNVAGLTVRWVTNQILSPGPVTNTIIYLGFQ